MIADFRPSKARPLPSRFYVRDPATVARELLGCLLIHELPAATLIGRIVETEAYLPAGDPACHGAVGLKNRNKSLFGPPGRAYVYAIHSRWCFNTVVAPEGVACAALVRAVEPLAGIETMQGHRGTEILLDLARGPGRLCEAFGINKELDGWDLTRGERLWIATSADRRPAESEVAVGPRIGVTSAHDLPLRFYLRGNLFVSGKRDHIVRARSLKK